MPNSKRTRGIIKWQKAIESQMATLKIWKVYKKYIEANVVPLAKFGAKFLVHGGEGQVKEGAIKSRTIIPEFSSYEMRSHVIILTPVKKPKTCVCQRPK